MKTEVEAKALAAAMKHASATLNTTNTIPIMANVRLVASGGKMEITASDLEMELRQSIPIMGGRAKAGEWATTVDAKRLAMIANSLPGDTHIGMTPGDKNLTVTAGRSRWVLPTLSADGYPSMPVDNMASPLEIDGAVLAEAINRTRWAVTNLEITGMAGLLLDNEAGSLRVVAVNRSGLAMVTTCTAYPDGASPVIVPVKLAAKLADIAADADGVSVCWNDRKIVAHIGDTVIAGKLLDATFPDYRRIIPKAGVATIFDPAAMTDAIKRVLITAEGRTRGIKMLREAGSVTVSATDSLAGSSSETIPADCEAGEVIHANGSLVLQTVTAIGGDSLEMRQGGPGLPMTFRRVVDDGAFAILMPMRGE